MRDVLFSLLVLGLLPVCFRRPFIGLLLFSWLAYMRAQDLTWGFARRQRWSFLVAGVTTMGFLSQPRQRWFIKDPRCYAMIALVGWVGLSILAAPIQDTKQGGQYVEFVKIVAVALFTTAVVTKREHLRILMWVIALSFGFYGLKVGLGGVLSGGQMVVLQGPGGMLEDNNNFAMALTMGIPLLLQMGASERRAILRRWAYVMVPLMGLVVLMTRSRGGFLALVITVGLLVWRSRNRVVGIAIGTAALAIGLMTAPPEYIERLRTITDYEQDGSAMGRLAAWRTGLRMAMARPLFGVGLESFQANYPIYRLYSNETPRVAHNAYFQIWAECGTPALLLYLFLIFWSFVSLWRVRAEARRHFRTSWIINYATMFEASLVAFVVGSTFLNRATFDLFYHFVAIVLVFEHIARAEMRSGEGLARARGVRGPLRAVEPGGFRGRARARGFRNALSPGGA